MASGWFWPIPFQVIQLYICLLEKPILIRRAAAKVYVQHLKPNNRSIHHITAKSDPSIIHRNKNQPQHTHTHISHDTSPSSMDWFSRENLNRKPMGFYHQIWWAFRFQFSHHPILWHHSPSFPHITAAAPAGTVPIGPSFRPPRTASTSTRTGHCFRPEPRRSHGP